MTNRAKKTNAPTRKPSPDKPPFRVPTMAEIAAVPPNGLVVVSTFSGTGGSCLGYRMAGYRVAWANEFVPEAQRSYRANAAPGSIMDGRDIKNVKPEEILAAIGKEKGELDLFDGSPPCFAAGTMILTRRGLVAIEEVRANDMVITHLGRWRRVSGTTKRKAEVIAVRGHGHPGLRTTREHPFFVRHMTTRWDPDRKTAIRQHGKADWRAIGSCLPNGQKGAKAEAWFWGMPGSYPEDIVPDVMRSDARSPMLDMSPELLWIAGLWLGDGWLRTGPTHVKTGRRGEVLICAAKAQADLVRERIEAAGLPYSSAEMRTTIRFTICHSGLAEWLEEDFGRLARGKTVPYWAFGMCEEWRRALLDGYVFADGHRRDGEEVRITSIGWSLIVGMAMLARTLGWATSLRSHTRSANSVVENRVVNTPGAIYALNLNAGPRSFLAEGDYCWGRIKEIRQLGIDDVYNLHVDEDESYLADGLIVHNCQAFSTAGSREAGWGKDKTYAHGAKQKNETLFDEYIRLLHGLMPKAFVAENVSGLVKGTAKGFFLEILAALKASGYRVEARLLDAQWLGVPQARQRIIFVGVRSDLGLAPVFPKPLPYRYSVRDALPCLSSGSKLRMGGHGFKEESIVDLDSKPSPTIGATGLGSFKYGIEEVIHDTGNFAIKVPITDRPCPSVTIGAGSANSCHYLVAGKGDGPTVTSRRPDGVERRRFTIAELIRICGFPDDFVLTGSYADQWARLGNSVPPVMMSHIAAAIRDNVLAKTK